LDDCGLGGEVSGKPETARSYRGAVVDDNAIISINIKWLLQSGVVVAGLVYSYYSVLQRITELERGMLDANRTITELVEKHIVEEQQRYAEMEEELKWYQKLTKKKKK
tara:strand:+ start:132 stop:455 length:324 start_codon:yes stop_codon:yes gene_type:complete